MESIFRQIAIEIRKAILKQFEVKTGGWLTGSNKIDLNSGSRGFQGVLPTSSGGTGSDVGFKDHSHDGTREQGQKLVQANTHQSPDTDVSGTSLHHTLGTGHNQAARGDHTHTFDDLSDVTLTTPVTGDIVVYNGALWVNAPNSQYCYVPISDGDLVDPEIVFDAFGDIVFLKVLVT